MSKTYNVLFLCTHNSARSILAEATLNHLPEARGRFTGYSAGSAPSGEVDPLALELLAGKGIDTTGLRSKSWDEFANLDAPDMDIVITVCDRAAQEACPALPGQPVTAHWGVADPAAVTGSEEVRRRAFLAAYTILARRIELLCSLPADGLERLRLEQRLREIGSTP